MEKLTQVANSKVTSVVKMINVIHVQENQKAACEKAKAAVAELKSMKLKEVTKKMEDSVEKTLTYCDSSYEHKT